MKYPSRNPFSRDPFHGSMPARDAVLPSPRVFDNVVCRGGAHRNPCALK